MEKVIPQKIKRRIFLPFYGTIKVGIDAVPSKKSGFSSEKFLDKLKKAAEKGIFPPIIEERDAK